MSHFFHAGATKFTVTELLYFNILEAGGTLSLHLPSLTIVSGYDS